MEHAPVPTQPFVLLWRSGSVCRALVIGRMSQRRLPCKIGYWTIPTPSLRCLDIVYDGLICDGNDVVQNAVRFQLEQLLSGHRLDVIRFDHLSVDHALYEPIRRTLRPQIFVEPHWRLSLAPDYEEIVRRFSPKHRKNLERAWRTLCRQFGDDVSLRVFAGGAQLNECLAETAALASRTYQAGLGCQFSNSPAWKAIVQTEASLGRFRCFWLCCAGRPVAFQMGMIYNGCYSLYFMGHVPEYTRLSPGILLHMRVIEHLCTAGVREYDYGFGDAEYKRMYGSASRMEATLQVFSTSWRARGTALLQTATLGISRMTGKCLHSLGAAAWLRKRWRTRLAGQPADGAERPRPRSGADAE